METDDLPEGWVGASLSDGLILDVQPGFACGKHNRTGEGIAHLRPMNVNEDGEIDLSNLRFVPKEWADREERLIRAGHVLFNNTNSAELVGKTAYYELPEARAFSNHMTRLRCNTSILDPRFCAVTLHEKWREGYFEGECSHHVSQASISRGLLLGTEIPLPPLAEQRRIVAKVEELLVQVNQVREHLARVPAILKRFRQSVLSAACSGGLTEDWRLERRSLDDAARDYERVLTQRKQFWSSSEGERFSSTRNSLFRDNGALDEQLVQDTTMEIPGTWLEVPLPTATFFQEGPGLRNWQFREQGTPFLNIRTFKDGRIDKALCQFLDPAEVTSKYEHFLLDPGDIVISSSGTIGKTAVVREEDLPLMLNTSTIRFRPYAPGGVQPGFLLAYLRSQQFIQQAEAASTGSAQVNFGPRHLREMVFPFPPIAEQREIGRRVEGLFKLSDRIEKQVEAATQRVDKLTQAILAKAFRGELVPTEAELARKEGRSYEPASVLLERIKQEREATGPLPVHLRRGRGK